MSNAESHNISDHSTCACYVVKVRAGISRGSVVAECPALPVEVLEAIARTFDRRRENLSFVAAELRNIAEAHALPGLATVYMTAGARNCRVPDPFAVPFEPTALDETNEGLESLCAPLAMNGVPDDSFQHRSTARRWILRILLPCLFVAAGALMFLLDLGRGGGWIESGALLALGALIMGSAMLAIRWYAGGWWILPGGLLLRRYGCVARHYTPTNSVLIVMVKSVGFEATLCRSYQRFQRSLTDLEVAALLAAWQSSVKVPNLEEFLRR